jgi:hypothetical protein
MKMDILSFILLFTAVWAKAHAKQKIFSGYCLTVGEA